jgi:D-glycerate 3-kinase
LNTATDLQAFLQRQRLPPSFEETAKAWYLPFAGLLAGHQAAAGRPLLVGLNGSQGSGKSTVAALLVQLLADVHGLRALDLSIDDFYLSRRARQALAEQVHPLLATRGVPGTHDVSLLLETLQRLTRTRATVPVPRFDKATDDRKPGSEWAQLSAPFDVVIVEGWCMGTSAQSEEALRSPVNELEASQDPDGSWRRYINDRIRERYQALYDRMDIWIMLQAPSFKCVYGWRREQESKLADRLLQQDRDSHSDTRVMTDEQLGRFIQHYQRLTEHALATLPARVHYLFRLARDRSIIAMEQPQPVDLRS